MGQIKQTIRFAFVAAVMLSLCSCRKFDLIGLFFGRCPTADERFAVSSKYNGSISPISLESAADEYRVYVCADLHIDGSTESTERYVKACLSDPAASDFSICLGDLVSGSGSESVAAKALAPLDTAPRRLFCAIGNHDINFNQWDEYIGIWKTASYTFEVYTPGGARDLYICLDSSGGTLGTSQMEWLKTVLSDTFRYRNVIVFTHTHFFKKDNSQGHTGNFNLEETYALLDLFADSGVDYVLSGHDHHYEFTQFRGVSYYTLGAMLEGDESGSYCIATVSDGLSLEEIKLGRD